MSQPVLVTGAAGGAQGSTGRQIAALLLDKGIQVRAFVHKLDARSDALRELGAEVVQGDLLDRDSVRASLSQVKRAYFTYSVSDGLLEATSIFARAAREAETELVVNNSQLQGARKAPSFRNMQHGLADCIFDWAEVGAVHLHASPYYENVRALVKRVSPNRARCSCHGVTAAPQSRWWAQRTSLAWPPRCWLIRGRLPQARTI